MRLEIPEQNKAVVYNEPVTLLPSEIRPGRSYETVTQAKILNLKTGEQIHSGRVEHRIERVSRRTFNTPAGKIEGYVIEINHKINLDTVAEIKIQLESGYKEGQGTIYRRASYTIEKAAFFGSTTSRTSELASSE